MSPYKLSAKVQMLKYLPILSKNFPVKLLYCYESIKEPISLLRLLRDCLFLKGFLYTSDWEKQRTMYRLVNCIFDAEVARAHA